MASLLVLKLVLLVVTLVLLVEALVKLVRALVFLVITLLILARPLEILLRTSRILGLRPSIPPIPSCITNGLASTKSASWALTTRERTRKKEEERK